MGLILQRLTKDTGVSLALQECLYGSIMALMFVLAAKWGAKFDSKEVFCLVVTGMNFSWGAIDGIVFYLMNLVDLKESSRNIEELRKLPEDEAVGRLMKEFEGTTLDTIPEEEEKEICRKIYRSEMQHPNDVKIDKRAMAKSSVMCFLITLLTVVPVVVPVLAIDDFFTGLNVASFIVSTLLFFVGFYLGKYLGRNGWLVGISLAGVTWAISIISMFTGGY